MNIRHTIEQRLVEALARAGAPDGTPAMVAPAAKPEFGDYQANGVMAVAKKLKTNPRKLAEQVVASADLADLAEQVEIAGPGFINITLKADFIAGQLLVSAEGDRLGVHPPADPQRVVVDYSGPNLAKEMHVGHLRSTIIGDAMARVLEFTGQDVIRQNHVGDWGTQFGMLTAYLDELGDAASDDTAALQDLEEFYRQAKQRFDAAPAFADRARQYVVKLQAGDPAVLASWKKFRRLSLQHCGEVYKRLNVTLRWEDVRGESFYNDDLPKVVADLDAAGLLRESQGAQCVFLPEFTGKDGQPLPVIVRKSDGGYLYATTDLAAMRCRSGPLQAGRILYITDSRQSLHFRQVFAVARAAGFVRPEVTLEHVGFGMMLGADRKPFKTRTGGTVKLADLLDEAERRALELVKAKSVERGESLADDELARIAHVVGIGAVKYADLSQNPASDYVFAWDKMLSLEGNTAPYMQYAYARIRSIFRKDDSAAPADAWRTCPIGVEGLTEPAERALAVKLLQFPETIAAVAADCLPNVLCSYLYELAGAFTTFYENCPVLKSDGATRDSRLALCDLTARTIRRGLNLLGIETVEQM